MSDLLRDLATFPVADRAAWRAAVDAALKGRPFDEALVRHTAEGLRLDPLYTRDDLPAGVGGDLPGVAPFARGFPALDGGSAHLRRGWVRVADVTLADVRRANPLLLQDLEGGIQRLVVHAVSPRAALTGPDDVVRGRVIDGDGGVWIDGADDLAALLHEVSWTLAPVAIVAPAGDAAYGTRLFDACATLRARGGHGVAAQIDVVGEAWAATDAGTWLRAHVPQLGAEAERGTHAALDAADARPLWISTAALRQAGADLVQEGAAALAAFVAVARALEGVVPTSRLLRLAEFRLAVGGDFFGEIARLRAFRRALGVVLDTMGAAAHAADALVTAGTAAETLTRRDVHGNLLRTTAQATAAVLGGADAIAIAPFDARLGGGSATGRRLARNLHSLLAEESDAGTVVDPAGGSFYLEARTEQLAEAIWGQFQAWEARGGLVSACLDGSVAAAIAERHEARVARERTRREPVLGVSVFPPPSEAAGAPESADVDTFLASWRRRVVADGGATPAPRPGLTRHYRGDAFERLRDEVEGRATRPVFGLLIGAPVSHAARLDWVRDLLAVAGLRLVEQAVSDDLAGLATAFAGSGAGAAIIVAADDLHGTAVVDAATALRQAGAVTIIVAGRPGRHEAAHRDAGVSGYAHVGGDAVAVLTSLATPEETTHVGA